MLDIQYRSELEQRIVFPRTEQSMKHRVGDIKKVLKISSKPAKLAGNLISYQMVELDSVLLFHLLVVGNLGKGCLAWARRAWRKGLESLKVGQVVH